MSSFTINAEIYTQGGRLFKLSHQSRSTSTKMNLNVYLPKQYYSPNESSKTIPTLYYLSGLTCSPQNASEKAGIFPYADIYGIAVVFPDTSPKDLIDVIPSSKDSWDFGEGASFYLNATKSPWSSHYKMYDYIVKELPLALHEYFNNQKNAIAIDFLQSKSIFGHSMGGFGSLMIYLKNVSEYKSVSLFAPISNPTKCPWGTKAFSGYLNSADEWSQYDPMKLIKQINPATEQVYPILIHQGKSDSFYINGQLQPESLVEASKNTAFDGKVLLNLVDGFDHSYYFIGSFIGEHMKHHAKALGCD